MMMGMVSVTTVNFVATKESAPFENKYMLLRNNAVLLGRQQATNSAAPVNGIFSLGSQKASDDVPVNVAHAEMYMDNGQVFIKDLGSRYGTWVDGVRIQRPTLLRDGSIVELGVPIQRSANTPATLEDEFLRPVSGVITIVK
ncbi:hypothetical protein DENSPDRAFT_839547 [Dentipellis sp. KUC8613]|nr:hypothetical protein DENSPDRAFT_839547 [Dentipellis sp. KUC8613]